MVIVDLEANHDRNTEVGGQKMTAGDILRQTIDTGFENLYEIEEIQMGGVGELSWIKLNYFGKVYDGASLIVPANIIDKLILHGSLIVYNREQPLPTSEDKP
jgi:hypothetical protein